MKNLLFIGVDQLRWDVIGPNKSVPVDTPNIDRLIASGVSFERAYATCPLCTPSRASMFTGDYAFTHGMGTNCDMYHALGKELSDPDRLLHRHLLKANYRCGFVGKWHVGVEKAPGDYGFEADVQPGYGNLTTTEAFKAYLKHNTLDYRVTPSLFFNQHQQTMAAGRWHGPVESTPAHFQTNQAIDMLEDMGEGDQPFFVTLQYWDPHGPHLICDEFYHSTDRQKIKPWPNFRDNLKRKPEKVIRERDDFYRCHPRTDAEVIDYIGWYCDHVAMLDHQIGRLLDYLEESGLADETLIVFTSDHGDMTGAHGGLIDKGLLYEEAMRVPLVFAHPDLKHGTRSGLALNMDILPTALALLGFTDIDRQADDLSAQIGDRDAAGRDYLLGEYHGLRYLYSQRMLVSDDGWKFIFSPGDRDELYDLNNDPHEMNNLVCDPSSGEVLARMREALMQQTARFEDPLRDCVAKFNGHWRTGSGQFDATSAYLTSQDGADDQP
ncbi:MAG: sulfatase-like hydrolase/transferase [Rhizobiaceae bacterium]